MNTTFRLSLIATLILTFACLSVATSQSTTIQFGDHSINWSGFENNTPQDNQDVIDYPDIIGGSLTIHNNFLTTVTVNFSEWKVDPFWNLLAPGDLFIDLGANQNWNYIFSFWDNSESWDSSMGADNSGFAPKDQTDLSGILYAIEGNSLPLNNASGYHMSNWTNGRDNHPIAFDPSSGIQYSTVSTSAHLSGWGTTSISFENLSIDLSGVGKIAIGWTQNCANDVLYETIPVPEPGTLLLFSTGLIGLLFVHRRATNSKS